MDITTSWIELLYKYGPYALLILFVFWVAPKQTKLFLQCKEKDKKLLCGGFAVASWTVIVVMTGFIYTHWRSTEVFTGTLGTYDISKNDIEFYAPLSKNLYVSSDVIDANRVQFKYAVVIDTLNPDQNNYVNITVRTGEHEIGEDHAIAISDLKAGLIHWAVNPENLEQLLVDDDNNPNTPAVPYATTANLESGRHWFSFQHWMAAYAADDSPQQIIDNLNSTNKYVRANGRAQLRSLSLTELQNMQKRTEQNSLAYQQIDKAIAKKQ